MQTQPFKQERFFVTTARAQLSILEELVTGLAGAGSEDACFDCFKSLAKIKQSALSVQAKAVYRGALAAEKTLGKYRQSGASGKDNNTPDNALASRLVTLRSLVGLYAEGLFELDPEFKRQIDSTEEIMDNFAPAGINASINLEIDNRPAKIIETKTSGSKTRLKTANENAANILNELLPICDNANHKQALSVLIDHRPELDIALKEQKQPKPKSESFDNIMRSITGRVLAEARLGGRDVSISYNVSFDEFGYNMAMKLQAVILAALLDIVKTGLPAGIGAISGEGIKSSHIVFGGTIENGRKTISIKWPGTMFDSSYGFKHSLSGFEQIGGRVEFENGPESGLKIICPAEEQGLEFGKLAKEA